EQGIDRRTGNVLVAIDPEYYRPTEVELLIGNPAKAKKMLGWEPVIKFEELVKLMARSDWEKVQRRGF
ncbi:MAG: GDP-mannose 4,6-dehydratase, partial [Chlorobiaceae bacterium]|nr:GDP-mannose 4,6-dehydratase [Chlorobiaceae bacterium]